MEAERLKSFMDEYGLGALLVTGMKNTFYLAGGAPGDEAWYEFPQGLCTVHLVIVPPDECFSVGGALSVPGFCSVECPAEQIVEDKIRVTTEGLRRRGLERSRIGIDMGHTPASTLLALQESLPAARFVCAESLLMRLRAVKTPEQILRVQRSIAIAEQAFSQICSVIRQGMSWFEVGRVWAKAVIDQGGAPHLLTPGGFIHSTPPSASSSNVRGLVRYPTRVEHGITTRLDFAVCYDGYYSDFKIPVCLGEPSSYATATLNEHVDRLQIMYATVRPGRTKREVNDTLVKEFRNVEEYSWWVHGVGLDVHEEPRIGSLYPSSVAVRPEIAFEEGNVLALEASWLVEETTLLEADGPRNLCQLRTREIVTL